MFVSHTHNRAKFMKNWHESERAAKSRKHTSNPGGAGGALEEARCCLTLDRLMARFGDPCPVGKKCSCPCCGKKAALLRKYRDRFWFKCFNPHCPSATYLPHSSFDEVNYLAFKLGLNSSNGGPGRYSDAAIAYMREAGVWRENHARRDEPNSGTSPNLTSRAVAAPTSATSPCTTSLANFASDTNMAPEEEPAESPTEVCETAESSFLETGRRLLEELLRASNLSERDLCLLFEKRGLTSITSGALRFRSNPRSNLQVLQQMVTAHGWAMMIVAGLALAADPERKLATRLNMQFCGKGQAGKIPKAERKNPSIKTKWGWVEPILIPYFDANGKIIALRPHKAGAPAGTAAGSQSLYIPRAFEAPFNGPEKFTTVIITEGEFKAAALWQTVGVGARQFVDENGQRLFNGEEYGVCAIPGISFSKNAETRAALEEWLLSVDCRKVIVAFDHEVKWNPNLPSYEADPACRYDSLIYAFYLAEDLSRKLRIQARVCLLPKAWLNASGKADWDGALAAIVHQQTPAGLFSNQNSR